MTAASSSNTIRDSGDGETPRGFGNAEVTPRQVTRSSHTCSQLTACAALCGWERPRPGLSLHGVSAGAAPHRTPRTRSLCSCPLGRACNNTTCVLQPQQLRIEPSSLRQESPGGFASCWWLEADQSRGATPAPREGLPGALSPAHGGAQHRLGWVIPLCLWREGLAEAGAATQHSPNNIFHGLPPATGTHEGHRQSCPPPRTTAVVSAGLTIAGTDRRGTRRHP